MPTAHEVINRHKEHSSPLVMVLMIVSFLFLGGLGIVMLKQPLVEFLKGCKVDAEIQKLELQRQMEQESLNQDVEVLLHMVGNKMSDLHNHFDNLSLRFETVTGVPLATAHNYASRRIHRAILRSYPMAETWSRLLNDRIRYDVLLEKERQLNRIEDRFQSKRVTRLDRVKLLELRQWVQRYETSLIPQHQRIDDIRSEAGVDLIRYQMQINNWESDHVTNEN